MLLSKMVWSALPFLIPSLHVLVCTLLLFSSVIAQQDKFTYKFSRGTMVCTNWQTGVICKHPPPYAMNTARSTDSHRNIISFDGDGNYALGFEKATFNSWYLSIYAYNPSNNSAGPSIWRASSVDGPYVQVPVNSSLRFLQNSNLELRDSKGGLQWTPNAWGLGVTEFVFNVRSKHKAVAGNAVLYNSANEVVWESMPPRGGNKFKLSMMRLPDMVCTNLKTGVVCSPPLDDSSMNPCRGTGTYRNIISSNADGKYALGFESWGGSDSFFLSIYRWNQSTGTPMGPSIWKAAHGRSNVPVPVNNQASITFRQNGAVELRDYWKKLVWTTGTKTGSSDLEFNFDTGDLYLYNRERSIVWRSGGEDSLQYVALYVNPAIDMLVASSGSDSGA